MRSVHGFAISVLTLFTLNSVAFAKASRDATLVVPLPKASVKESRADAAVASRFPTDPAPTYRVALVDLRF
jgi:hypothetical protein